MADTTPEEEIKFEYRETVELETPYTKAKVVLHGYLTGDQNDEINDILSQDLDMADEDSKFSYKNMQLAGRRTVEFLVKSVDGKEEGACEAVRKLPAPDYNFVCAEVGKIRKASNTSPKAS